MSAAVTPQNNPQTVDQQIYLELKNINQTLGVLTQVLGQIRDSLQKATEKK
jgi:hypothetical protein